MGQFRSSYVPQYSALISARAHLAPASATSTESAPKLERVATVERKVERLAQASVPGASTDQPVGCGAAGVLRRGRGAGRRFTKVTAAGAAVARAQALAPEQRQDIARRAASARWGRKTSGKTQGAQ
jgi:hypothetical protein